MSHVLSVVALSRALSKTSGRAAVLVQWALESRRWRCSSGGVMAPQPLCQMAPSQVLGKATGLSLKKQMERTRCLGNVYFLT